MPTSLAVFALYFQRRLIQVDAEPWHMHGLGHLV
jgi:hypothetical protein